jgi:hypothetical protein
LRERRVPPTRTTKRSKGEKNGAKARKGGAKAKKVGENIFFARMLAAQLGDEI